MKVTLDRIEQLKNGSAHIVFFTDINTHFTSKFSFTVPKAFASTVCRYIEEIDKMSLKFKPCEDVEEEGL